MTAPPSARISVRDVGYLGGVGRKWTITRRGLVALLGGVVALAAGLFFLAHPTSARSYGDPRWADLPSIFGVGMLLVPVLVAGFGLKAAWDAVELEREARRRRRMRAGDVRRGGSAGR
jgi:hypothetical protein